MNALTYMLLCHSWLSEMTLHVCGIYEGRWAKGSGIFAHNFFGQFQDKLTLFPHSSSQVWNPFPLSHPLWEPSHSFCLTPLNMVFYFFPLFNQILLESHTTVSELKRHEILERPEMFLVVSQTCASNTC